MPEGPEIRRAADRLAAVLAGERVEAVQFAFAALRRHEDDLRGATVTALETRGKALLTHFDNDWTIYSHNQLYGVWRVVRRDRVPDSRRSLRLALHTARHSALLYSASDISVWRRDELGMHPFLARIGPDLLSAGIGWRDIAARLTAAEFRGRSLGSLYLDQGFLAGTGNYLRSEILFCARLHPGRRPRDLGRAETGRLARETLAVTQRSYRTGGITLTPRLAQCARRRDARFERRRFFVFGRDGLPCYRCGNAIDRSEVGSRRVYLCTRCQPREG